MYCKTEKADILLSCIVPFYNALPYLGELTSTLFAANSKLVEFIFVNDASTDKGELFLADLIQRQQVHNTTVISLPENRGPSAARNTGLEMARGKYIWCIDSDDLVVPSSWPQVLLLIQEETLDVLIIGFEFASIQTRRSLVYDIEKTNVKLIERKTIETRFLNDRTLISGRVISREDGVIAALFRDKMIYTWSFIVKSSLYHGIRFPEKMLLEDVCTLPKLFFKANTFFFLDVPVILYRKHQASLLGRGGKVVCISLCEAIPKLKSYIFENSVQITSQEWLEINSFHLQALVWAANNYFLLKLTADGAAMTALIKSLDDYKMTIARFPSGFTTNVRSLQRPVDRYVARVITLSPTFYFILRKCLSHARPVWEFLARVLGQ